MAPQGPGALRRHVMLLLLFTNLARSYRPAMTRGVPNVRDASAPSRDDFFTGNMHWPCMYARTKLSCTQIHFPPQGGHQTIYVIPASGLARILGRVELLAAALAGGVWVPSGVSAAERSALSLQRYEVHTDFRISLCLNTRGTCGSDALRVILQGQSSLYEAQTALQV